MRDLFAGGDEARGEMADISTRVNGLDHNLELRDGNRPIQADRQACDVREAERGGGPGDGVCDQRRGRTGVLMFRMPGTTGEFGGLILTVIERYKCTLRSIRCP